MNSQKPQEIFNIRAYAGVMQDKQPPWRFTIASEQPSTAREVAVGSKQGNATATAAVDRPTHHGSETRQTEQITGRVLPHIKSRVRAMAATQSLTESKVVASLVEKALQIDADLQYGAMLRPVIQDQIRKDIQSATNRTANLALEAFYSAEEGRVICLYILRFLLGEDTQILQEIIKQSQEQAREHLRGFMGAKEREDARNQQWQ
jgi:hypothetical protein